MKYLLSTILLIISAQSIARAGEQITYFDFVMMEKEQKREVIKLVQKYSAQAEYIQNYVLKESSKKKKRTSYVDFFFNQFKAYAGTTEHDEPERKTCFYGGWLSHSYVNTEYTKNNDGVRVGLCANPARLNYNAASDPKDENIFTSHVNDRTNFNEETAPIAIRSGQYYDELQAEVKQSGKVVNKIIISPNNDDGTFDLSINQYVRTTSNRGNSAEETCSTPKDIICNPMVYGRHNGGLLCVPKLSDDAYNTSFLCEKALLHIKSQSEDAYNNALDAAVTEAQNRPTLFSNTLVNMYDTCICRGTAYEGYTDSNYANSVYNTRTCVAIINSSRNILKKIGENEACSSFDRSDLGEVSNMSLFFNRAYNHLNSVALGLEDISPQSMNNFYSNRSNRRQEEERITRVANPVYESLRLNVRNDDPDTQVCPISMDEIKEGSVQLSSVPDLTNMIETITIGYKIDGQIVDINPGDVSISLINQIEGIALGELTDAGNNVTFTAPLLIAQNYRINVTVNKNNTSNSGIHFVKELSVSCNAQSEVLDNGLTVIALSSNMFVEGNDDVAHDVEGMSFKLKIGDAEPTEFSGDPIDLRGTTGEIKVFANIDGIEDQLECNGSVIAGDQLAITVNKGEADKVNMNIRLDVNLMNGNEMLSLALDQQQDVDAHLEIETIPAGITYNDGHGLLDDGKTFKLNAITYHDRAYKIVFKTTYNDQEVRSEEIDIPQQTIACVLSNYTPPQGSNGHSLLLELKVGDSPLDPSIEKEVSITYGEAIEFSEVGVSENANQIEYTAAGTPGEGDSIVGSVSIPSLSESPIQCSGPEIDNTDPDETDEIVATCNINTSKGEVAGGKVKLSAVITYKRPDEDEVTINSAELLSEYGASINWSKSSAVTNDEETISSGTRTPANAGSGIEIEVPVTADEVRYTASVSGLEGFESCGGSDAIIVQAGETTDPEVPTPTDNSFEVDNSGINWQAPQAPQGAPRRMRRGLMFRGNR
tara:strand:+ start:117115 stop:120090 length:2976 start_codon:yes stop_codon:yes gene_type:complete